MFKFYTAANLLEATLLQGMLAQEGIEVHIFNRFAQGAIGELPVDQARPQLWLELHTDLSKAETLVKNYEHRRHRHDPVYCRHCHEANPETFETCWQCGQDLDW